jgi:hypothetical protein
MPKYDPSTMTLNRYFCWVSIRVLTMLWGCMQGTFLSWKWMTRRIAPKAGEMCQFGGISPGSSPPALLLAKGARILSSVWNQC